MVSIDLYRVIIIHISQCKAVSTQTKQTDLFFKKKKQRLLQSYIDLKRLSVKIYTNDIYKTVQTVFTNLYKLTSRVSILIEYYEWQNLLHRPHSSSSSSVCSPSKSARRPDRSARKLKLSATFSKESAKVLSSSSRPMFSIFLPVRVIFSVFCFLDEPVQISINE